MSQRVANPTRNDFRPLKRLMRYLRNRQQSAIFYGWQDWPNELTVFSDGDWAGCTTTRRSTSGGIAMHGAHCIRHWSKTQSCIALSSAEADLYAIVKASTEGLGLEAGGCAEGQVGHLHGTPLRPQPRGASPAGLRPARLVRGRSTQHSSHAIASSTSASMESTAI